MAVKEQLITRESPGDITERWMKGGKDPTAVAMGQLPMAAESSCLSGLYRVQSQGKYPQNSKSKSDTLVTDHDVFLTVGNGSGTQGA